MKGQYGFARRGGHGTGHTDIYIFSLEENIWYISHGVHDMMSDVVAHVFEGNLGATKVADYWGVTIGRFLGCDDCGDIGYCKNHFSYPAPLS